MNFDIIITRLNELTNRFNQLVNNSKRIPELPTATNGNKKIAAYNESNQLVEQFDLTAALQGFETLDDGVKALGSITKDENEFTFGIGFQWKINGINYANTEVKVRKIEPAKDGFFRIDIAVVDTNNNIIIIQGIESDTVAVQPLPPPNTLLLIPFSINGATVVEGDPAPIGNQFVKKQEFSRINSLLIESESKSQLSVNGENYYLLNTELDGVVYTGLLADNLTLDPNTEELPYNGKTYYFENISLKTIELQHEGNADFPLYLPKEQNLILPPKGIIYFKMLYTGGTTGELIYLNDNFSKQEKPIDKSSNFTAELDQVYHTVATCTITDPTPFEGKGYVVRVINGTTTIGGSDYTPGQIVVRTFHSGSWVTFVYDVNGKFLSSTQANYTDAATPLNIDDKAIIFQGGTPKLVNVSELGGGKEKKIYTLHPNSRWIDSSDLTWKSFPRDSFQFHSNPTGNYGTADYPSMGTRDMQGFIFNHNEFILKKIKLNITYYDGQSYELVVYKADILNNQDNSFLNYRLVDDKKSTVRQNRFTSIVFSFDIDDVMDTPVNHFVKYMFFIRQIQTGGGFTRYYIDFEFEKP